MKFLLPLLIWCVLVPPVSGPAQSADDRYVQIYGMIEEADRLAESGQDRQAVTKYLEAQIAIKDLQQMHPGWSEKLVAFRLDYISTKLEPLTRKSASPPASSDQGGAASVNTASNQIKVMQESIARLATQNALLEAKLREALSVQPAAVDPRELAGAEARIKVLQKERDLLAVTLEQSVPKGARAGGQDAQDKQSLVTQSAVVSVLQKQNEELQKQIASLSTRMKPAGRANSEDLLKLKETVAALEASNRVMKEEQVTMENRLVDFVQRHGNAATRDAELQRQLAEAQAAAKHAKEERDALLERLNTVTKELNQRDTRIPTVATQELEKQLESIRARLQIFQAKQVPFSAEELALFKQTPIKVAGVETNAPAPKKPSKEVPAAADSLLAEALRAIDAGRFDEAEKKYRDVLRQDEQNVFVMANLAAVQMDQEKVAEAEATLKRALGIDPQDAVSLYLMGSIKLRQEKLEEALEALSLSAQVDPEKANTQYFLGKALIQKGNRAPAESALRKAIQLKPGWGDAHYLLAVLYATQEPGYRELAQYHYKKAIGGGAARNVELEQWMEKRAAAAK